MCRKLGKRSCKELREETGVDCIDKALSTVDLATLGTLGSVLPALKLLRLVESSGAAGPDGVQQLAEGLGAGALPAVLMIVFGGVNVGDAGASALAAALGRGALPRLKTLVLARAGIGDPGLVALAPALRRLPALVELYLQGNPFGDEGIAALVAPPPLAGALPTTTEGLKNLERLDLQYTRVSDAGCAALESALDSCTLPALEFIKLNGIPASADAKAAVYEAVGTLERMSGSESESGSEEEASEDEEGEDEGVEDDVATPASISIWATEHSMPPLKGAWPTDYTLPMLTMLPF